MCVSFLAIKEYLRKLLCGRTDRQTDRQTEVINTFQLSLECVKNARKVLTEKAQNVDL